MSKHCSCKIEPALFARSIIVMAGELTEYGEEVGSIKAQLNRASRRLGLPVDACWRARHLRAGPRSAIKIRRAARNIIPFADNPVRR